MFDDIPIVPNLYEAPLNPQVKDCYYNITVDKYYIYDGTEGLEVKTATETDEFILKYSQDGGTSFTTETYTDFNTLCIKMASNDIKTATDIFITTPSQRAILIPRSDNLSLDGVALLKLNSFTSGKKDIFELKYSTNNGNTFVTEEYEDFLALINRTNSSTMNNVTDIEISMREVEDPNIVKINNDDVTKTFVLQYSKDGGASYTTETYSDFTDLTDKTHSSVMDGVTDIRVYSKITDPSVVGKIYPKIIFNQQLIKQLKVNNLDAPQGIFDGVLVFYKTPSYKLSGIDSSNEDHSITFSNYASLKKYIQNEISSGSMIDVSIEEVGEE